MLLTQVTAASFHIGKNVQNKRLALVFSYFKWALGYLWNWLYEGKSDSSVVLVCDIDPV